VKSDEGSQRTGRRRATDRLNIARRQFIAGTGLVGAGTVAGLAGCEPDRRVRAERAAPTNLGDWEGVRAAFDLDPAWAHFAAFVLAAHPRPVRQAIDAHRRGLDANTEDYLRRQERRLEGEVLDAAAAYLGADQAEIALTDSTTMGLGLLYGGLRLRPGQEVLATEHDFYSTHESLRLRAGRDGTTWRRARLYHEPHAASVDEIVAAVRRALAPSTRALAVTWVHSSTGVKLPVRAIADALAEANRDRDPADRVLLCVDGVHGLGVEPAGPAALGCDFLAAGTHKWLFGPRGTGLLWARRSAWGAVGATIPSFDRRGGRGFGGAMTPGGYHSFEHRWALGEAFRFHLAIGKQRVAARTREQATQLKEGLRALRHVRLATPMSAELSAGIVCFEVDGYAPNEVVGRLADAKVMASVTPYDNPLVRLGPSIVTGPEDVERALRAVHSLA
jgi:selenocysteine lyase/cysteine desulfurase